MADAIFPPNETIASIQARMAGLNIAIPPFAGAPVAFPGVLPNYANAAAAITGGVGINKLFRNGETVMYTP